MENFSKIETTPIKRRIAIGLAFLVGGIGLAACGKTSETHSKQPAVVSVSKAEQDCRTFENVDQSSHYLLNSAMPTSEKSIGKALNQNTAAEYVRSLFGAEGPLAAKGDIHTLALTMALVTIPAHEGNLAANGQVTNYNYFNQYSQQLNYFQSNPNSIAGACEQSLKTMIEDGQYTNDFAQKGQAVTLFQPERNQKGEVINYKPVKVIVGEVLNGVEFKARLLNQPGYTPVFITENGEVYVKGVVLENIPKPENQNKPTVTTVPQPQSEQIPSQTPSQQENIPQNIPQPQPSQKVSKTTTTQPSSGTTGTGTTGSGTGTSGTGKGTGTTGSGTGTSGTGKGTGTTGSGTGKTSTPTTPTTPTSPTSPIAPTKGPDYCGGNAINGCSTPSNVPPIESSTANSQLNSFNQSSNVYVNLLTQSVNGIEEI